MNPTEHPDESLLLRFAMNESGLADSATIRNHVAACPQCRRYVDTTRAMEDALRNERTWGTTREAKSLQSRIVEFRERLRREDAEARDLLNKPLESEYTFHYEKIAAMPHTLSPDRLAKSPKKPVIETVDEKRVITDGTQTLELYRLPSMHAETLLIGYLPKQRVLYEVDVFNAPPAPAANAAAPPPTPPNPATVEFVDTITKMKLDVDTILAGHGPRVVTMKDLRAAAGRTSTN